MTDQTAAGHGDTRMAASAYRVLARKYRPSGFEGLIGQEALVRTLTNAIRSGRLAHAWLLTGVRGVGKTTTARIIARALNCIGPDGTGGPTPEPCGVCPNCTAIAEDRHVDVLEMDAASRTGVDDIRELIEGVRYRPVSARYKIYIIDEVHMLSNNAFNALLKTLEEPPEHVKFIFATTESRKIPITVLSRCQRFDLRRVGEDVLAAHLGAIAVKESVAIEPAALALIARAADGSVRDALSILDQAIAHGAGMVAAASAAGASATIAEAQVREMLGLADRTRVFDLFEATMRGEVAAALAVLAEQHQAGADAATVIEDLLELTHWITRIKVAPDVAKDVTVPEAERVRGTRLAGALSMPVLARAWQMLLKGLQEAQFAPDPTQAAEMVLVRLAYAADLPAPADLVGRLTQSGGAAKGAPASEASAGGVRAPRLDSSVVTRAPAASVPGSPALGLSAPTMAGTSQPVGGRASEPVAQSGASSLNDGAHALAPQPAPTVAPSAPPQPSVEPMPAGFREAVALFSRKREGLLHSHLTHDVHLVHFEAGRIEFRPRAEAPRDLPNKISERLSQWTGQRWLVSLSDQPGQPTLSEQDATQRNLDLESAGQHPFVKATLAAFPGAKITDVRTSRPQLDFVPTDGEPLTDAESIDEEGEDAGQVGEVFSALPPPPMESSTPSDDDAPWDDGAPPPRFEGDYAS